MSASKLVLPVIEKGSTYSHALYWKNCSYLEAVTAGYTDIEQNWLDSTANATNLTGCTAKLQVRVSLNSDILLELSTLNGGIIITPTFGKIVLSASATTTTALNGTGGIYDLEIYYTGGNIVRLIEGKVVFKAEVTR